MMSSETSTEARPFVTPSPADDSPAGASSLKPWQFFLLAGMLAATASVIVATGQSMAAIVALSLTVVATSMVGLGAYRMLLPFASPQSLRAPEIVRGRARAALEREKILVLRSIKDLEFDCAMGKVAPGDFDEMSGRLRARAVDLIQQLDGSGAYRARIEQELTARLAKTPPSKASAASKPAATVGTMQACPTCGTGNDGDARFCKTCGARLEAAR